MSDFDHGIRALNKSLEDLKDIQNDIKKNDLGKIEQDWKKACQDMDDARKDLTDAVKKDGKLKRAAFQAYEAYRKCDVKINHADVTQLSSCIQRLVTELKNQH